MSSGTNKHWAEEIAEKVLERRGVKKHVVATGITPSGHIHIGNLREIIIADAVRNALLKRGADAEMIYVADTYDPLRRRYPFLPENYEEHVGKPLSEIPDPEGCCENYAEHFLNPFLEALEELSIEIKLYRADELYKRGAYADAIKMALERRDDIKRIIDEATGRRSPEDWSPFNPICERCGRLTTTKVKGFDAGGAFYECECGHGGFAPFKGGGKLTWRVDWAARWKILGVTVEPFGKDHAVAGGSYDTGVRISKEIYGYEPPFPIPFEHIILKLGGRLAKMSSSAGVNIPVKEILEVVPPEILKYAILRTKPERHIEFDPSLGLLSIIDEYERRFAAADDVPFRHVVMLVQLGRRPHSEEVDLSLVRAAAERSGYVVKDEEAFMRKVMYAERWLRRFAPESMKFELKEALPPEAETLTEGQKAALRVLASTLRDNMTAEELHNAIYAAAENVGIKGADAFKAVYIALLGKPSGPRAGWFLASLDKEFVRRRFLEAAG
ncbi:MAG: Lysyl-tRNA synthetase [Candidatus Alkanophagales archaeon MCA70_species_1]|nr:Lysyl-tRNA synthetase [Candidatus Alkanophaga volatiphilum]